MRMHSLFMNTKRTWLCKRFVAHIADKWSFSCMGSDVRLQGTAVSKRRGARRTGVRLLASVTSHVTLQTAGVRELFEAVTTGVRPLTGVYAHVDVKAAVRAEVFVTVFTLVLLFLCLWERLVSWVLRRFFLDFCYSFIVFNVIILRSLKSSISLWCSIHACNTVEFSGPISTGRTFGFRGLFRPHVVVRFYFSLGMLRRTLLAQSNTTTLLKTTQYSRCIVLL